MSKPKTKKPEIVKYQVSKGKNWKAVFEINIDEAWQDCRSSVENNWGPPSNWEDYDKTQIVEEFLRAWAHIFLKDSMYGKRHVLDQFGRTESGFSLDGTSGSGIKLTYIDVWRTIASDFRVMQIT